jgi:RimJ/RimL family protein N-acetyltransferase
MAADEDFTTIETERLILRRFTEDDLDAFVEYRSEPGVSSLPPWESYSRRDADEFLAHQRQIHPGAPGEWFQFAIESKDGGSIVGDCALHVTDEDPQQAEVGFTTAPDHQGVGYATEAVEALLDYVFEDLGKHRVYALTDVDNAPAIVLLEKLGFRREGTFVESVRFKRRWASEHLYAMLRREWLGEQDEA